MNLERKVSFLNKIYSGVVFIFLDIYHNNFYRFIKIIWKKLKSLNLFFTPWIRFQLDPRPNLIRIRIEMYANSKTNVNYAY